MAPASAWSCDTSRTGTARAAVEHAVERGDTAAQLRRLVELERRGGRFMRPAGTPGGRTLFGRDHPGACSAARALA